MIFSLLDFSFNYLINR